jgi:hypothetical protein
LYRNYSRNYHTFYSNAISENSTPQNEQALYWGWKYTFNKNTGPVATSIGLSLGGCATADITHRKAMNGGCDLITGPRAM